MVDNHKPKAPDSRPLIVEEESSVAITVTPKIATQNNWLGPKSRAILALNAQKKRIFALLGWHRNLW